jgi:N-acetylglucosaminyl-diphospho-decaprenol L-rhamnosyltransferase
VSAPDLSVVVVSYNVAALLERCLDAILAPSRASMEVFVVDNASADGSAALVRSRFPDVTLIANTRNRGFGAANNQALRWATGRHVAFVNPDAEVQGDSLAALVRFLDAHPRAAVAGGRLRYGDGAFQHSAFRFPSLGQIALDAFPLHWRLLESRLNGRYPRRLDETAFEMDFPLGAFFAVRRSAIEAVGSFDEGYFMYVEEVDWCYRLKRAGWEVWHCPDALAVHHGGRSTVQREAAMLVELHRSRWRFYRKHYSVPFRVGARVLTGAGMLRRAGAAWWAGRRATPGAAARHAEARACLEVLRL